MSADPIKSLYSRPAGLEELLGSVTRNFARNLQRLLKARKITQRQLAKMAGVTEAQVSRWVGEENLPRPPHWDILSEIFNCDYAQFVCDPDNPPPLSQRYDDLIEKLADRAGYKLVKRDD